MVPGACIEVGVTGGGVACMLPGGQWVVPPGGSVCGGTVGFGFGTLGEGGFMGVGLPGVPGAVGVGVLGGFGVVGLPAGCALAASVAMPSSTPESVVQTYLMVSSL